MKNFRDLKVWHKSHQLTLEIYKATASFPKEERYGLTSQMRRASTSIPANIAEGCGRNGDTELARFLQIAMGSASELEYHLILARDLDLLPSPNYEQLERQTLEIMIEEMNRFIERSNRNERRIEQLIGYSITNESEHLDIEQRFRNLEARMKELDNRN